MTKMFELIDKDGSGWLSEDEVIVAMVALGLDDAEIERLKDEIPDHIEFDFIGFQDLIQPESEGGRSLFEPLIFASF